MAKEYGYLRLSEEGRAHRDEYKRLLSADGAGAIYEDQPTPGVRPEFEKLLKDAAAGDVIAVIRPSHLSANPKIAADLLKKINQAGLHLKVLKPGDDLPKIETLIPNPNTSFNLLFAFTGIGGGFGAPDGGDGGGNGHN